MLSAIFRSNDGKRKIIYEINKYINIVIIQDDYNIV